MQEPEQELKEHIFFHKNTCKESNDFDFELAKLRAGAQTQNLANSGYSICIALEAFS
jgi:hypothetical protein